jgi:hypothetical protein
LRVTTPLPTPGSANATRQDQENGFWKGLGKQPWRQAATCSVG